MKRISLLIALLCCMHPLWAQTTYTVSGSIKDTTGQHMIGANILLISGKDSLHTTSNETGAFQFTNVPWPDFTLRISLIGYDTWYKQFSYRDAGTSLELPLITLSMKLNTLKEVVVKGARAPVLIKGDTLEYAADQYHLRENSVVEDLLRRLPGIQVDRDGNITTMGQSVTKVKINGKEFMVSDIRTLMRILPVDLIDKIQLIDDYGDLARATGRRVGEPEKVINLQTKSDLNQVYQAQVMGGVGSDGRYNAQAMGNYFSEKQQLSVMGNTNNTSAQEGKAVASTGNLNYRGVYSKAFSVNVGLMGGQTNSDVSSVSNVQTVTSDGTLYNANTSSNSARTDNWAINLGEEYKPRDGDLVNFNFNTNRINNNNNSLLASHQTGFQLKDQLTGSDFNSTSPTVLGGLFASHRFKGLGRIWSLSFFGSSTDMSSNQNSIDSIRYYNADSTIAKDSILHQLLHKVNNNLSLNGQASWVEPLDSFASLELRYSMNYQLNDTKQETNWVGADGKPSFIDSLSNHYKVYTTQQQIELNFRHNKGKVDYTVGAKVQPSNMHSVSANGSAGPSLSNTKVVPVAQLIYRLPEGATASIAYTGNVVFPTFQQLQPIPDLTNPSTPVIGNPELKPSYMHSIFLNYRKAGMNTLFLHLNGNLNQDQVVTNVVLVKDSFNTVKQETHFLNTSGNYNVRFVYGWSQRLKDGKYNLFADGNAQYGNNVLYLDNERKGSQNLVLTQSVRGNMLRDWLELTGGVTYTFNHNVYVLQQNSITDLSTWNFNFYGKVYFLKNSSLGVDFNKQLNSGYSGAVSANPMMLNTTFEETLFKKKLTLRAQAFNVLNETSRVTQSVSGNTISESKSNLLGRYFMVTLQCDLRLLKGGK
jgi:hypothetical protein